jgi:hypothetical protein
LTDTSKHDQVLPGYVDWRHGKPGRHPMDYKYRCGFDPEHKSLFECVSHWQTCKSNECQQKAANWADLKEELLRYYWTVRR